MFKKLTSALLCLLLLVGCVTGSLTASASTSADINGLRRTVMVGYFHLFKNGAGNGVKLTEMPAYWDVLMCAFGEPDSATSGNVIFDPTKEDVYATDNEFIADVAAAKRRGQKITLSIGGQYGIVTLDTRASAEKFVETVGGAISKYNLDGLDIDLEGSSLTMSNETDIKNPVTPCIVNLIYAIQRICAQNGDDFILTYTPETRRCQDGIAFYNGSSGTYLPLLEATRDNLSWLQVQYYNVANCYSPDGLLTNFGTVDFNCRLMDMMIEGFYVGQMSNMGQSAATYFEGLRPDQMVMGVPSGPNSAGTGQMSYSDYCTAMGLMLNGGTTPSGYTIKNPSSSFRGIMTWSANWDIFQNYNFSAPIHEYLLGVNGYELTGDTVNDSEPPVISSVSCNKTSASYGDSLTWNVIATGESALTYNFELYVNGVKKSESGYTSSASYTVTAEDDGSYYVNVTAKDADGYTASEQSSAVTVKTDLTLAGVTATVSGQTINVEINARGGVPSYTYFCYVLKDGQVFGREVFSSSRFHSITVSEAGNYKVRIYVRDSVGALVASTTSVTI